MWTLQELADHDEGDSFDDDNDKSIYWLAGATYKSDTNYFTKAAALAKGKFPAAPWPFCTFAGEDTAFHLQRDPIHRRLAIEKVAEMYNLPDLQPAFIHFINQIKSGRPNYLIGGQQMAAMVNSIPFNAVDVWMNVQVQGKAFHYPHGLLAPQTICALPPSPDWQHGRSDPVIINLDPCSRWPQSGLKGE